MVFLDQGACRSIADTEVAEMITSAADHRVGLDGARMDQFVDRPPGVSNIVINGDQKRAGIGLLQAFGGRDQLGRGAVIQIRS